MSKMEIINVTKNQIEKLKYRGSVCVSGLTASGKSTHSHLLSGEFGLTYVSGSQIQLNFLGISPIQTRDFWITQEAKNLWNEEQFNKIDAELLRLESRDQGYIFDGSTMPWRHKRPSLCIWLESDLKSRVIKSIISHHGKNNIAPIDYFELIKDKDDATVNLCKSLYNIEIGRDLSCFNLIIDISSIIEEASINAALQSIKITHSIIKPAVGWYLTGDEKFRMEFDEISKIYVDLIKCNTVNQLCEELNANR
ncbi:MAG: hypothetical protein HYZ10_10295 [Ignavibacteriales bacterium]|nr:hypothetical protein [Ignavibacteriales bacterium]